MSTSNDSDSGRLWAPWRIDYILAPKPKDMTCPFCVEPNAAPSPDNLVLTRTPRAMVMLNRYPYTGCHLMVIPHRHVSRLTQLDEAEYMHLMALVRHATQRLEVACQPGGINMGMNQGEAAGAGIESHLHLHLVPRWSGDTNFMTVTAGARVVSQGLEHAWRLLRPHFSDLDGPAAKTDDV